MSRYRPDAPTEPIPRLSPGPGVLREPAQFIRRDPNRRPEPPPAPPAQPRQFRPPQPSPRPRPKAAAPNPSRAPRRRRSLVRRIVITAIAIGLTVTAVALASGVWLETGLRRIAVLGDYSGRPTPGSGTNWLLVGSDGRSDLTPEQQAELSTGGDLGSSRTDTILLVHIPGMLSTEPAAVVSIPRDSYLEIPGWGMDKVNAAFAEGGAPLLVRTIEQATGLRVDHYAEVGFSGFGAVVDALGGVRICLTEPLNDPLAGVDLPAGCQGVDGRAALGYVRSRDTPRADLDRMVHQREFMTALLERVSSPVVWLNPWRWYAVARALAGAVSVDLDAHVWDLVWLAWSLRGAGATLTVPIGEFSGTESGSVVVWDAAVAEVLFGALRTDSVIPQEVFDAQP